MGHVGNPLTPCAFKFFQARGHLIDVAHGVTNLIAAPCVQAGIKITLRNSLGSRLHFYQWTHPMP